MSRVSYDDVVSLISGITDVISPDFFFAMAKRESGLDPANVTPESNGTTSIGLWQVNADEAKRAGVSGDLKDPSNNAAVIVYMMTQNLYALANKYNFDSSAPPSDIWYYLAASHNAGLGRVEQWIDETGIDWAATKAKHPTFVTIAKGYADDIGGAVSSSSGGQAPDDAATDLGGSGTDIVVVLLIAGAAILIGVMS